MTRNCRRGWRHPIGVPVVATAVATVLACVSGATRLVAQDTSLVRVGQSWTYESGDARFRVDVVATGLKVPWGLAFLPDGRALVTDRPGGRLSLVDVNSGAVTPVDGVPSVYWKSDGGLMDVLLHPKYRRNGWIYFSYAAGTDSANTVVVDRARLRGARLVDRERVFTAQPLVAGHEGSGGRLAFDGGYLYVSLGDRTHRDLVQDLSTDEGKIVRLREDGRVPRDNPYARRRGARPGIWSYGHRNPQGLVVNPTTGELWEDEHGPMGGDEVNVIRRACNYGWPVITYGEEYDGRPVGDGITRKEGMAQPLYYYVPSIAPSGMEFYTGAAFPAWRGNLFMGALKLRHLNRLVIEHGRVVREERLLADRGWRVRVVRQGPDGFLYLGVDRVGIVRLRPE